MSKPARVKNSQSVARYTKEILLTLPDPDTHPLSRLTELVAARMAQVGFTPSNTDVRSAVKQAREKLRKKLGPLTPKKLREYAAHHPANPEPDPRHDPTLNGAGVSERSNDKMVKAPRLDMVELANALLPADQQHALPAAAVISAIRSAGRLLDDCGGDKEFALALLKEIR